MRFTDLLRPCVIILAALNLCGQVDVPRNFAVISNNAVAVPGTLTKTGAGILSFVGPSGNTCSNDIAVGVDGGTLRIGGNIFYAAGVERTGTTLPNMTSNNTVTIQRGGIFEIKDNAVTTFGYVANRLGSAGNRPNVRLEGGTLLYNGAAIASTLMTQSVGNVTLASGASTITVNRNSSGTPNLIARSLIPAPGAYVQFVANTLGSGAATESRVLFDTAPAAIGGGGAAGTKTMSIVPGMRYVGDLLYYGANGLRALLPTTEYDDVAGNDINVAASAQSNVRIINATPVAFPALSADKTVNSLVLTASAIATWAMGNKLTLTSGQFLNTANNRTISSGSLTAGAGNDIDLDMTIMAATTTLGANVIDNGSGKITLVKNGAGVLTLSTTTDNTYSGGTIINEGSLTTGTTANRRYLGTGPVKVNNVLLTLGAIGATANEVGDDFTAIHAAQIGLAVASFSGETFNIGAGSVIAGAASALNSLDRGRGGSSTTNITLAADAVVAHPALTTAFVPGTGTIKNPGAASDLYYGLNAAQNNDAGTLTIGSGTPFKGISATRSNQAWQRGVITVAAGTDSIFLQGLTIPGTTPSVLTLGNTALTAGAPVINLADSGSVDAQVLNSVVLEDNLAVYGDAANNLNFVVNSGATLTASAVDAMGSGAGIATAQVKDGGTLALVNPAAINGAVTFEAGGRITANNAGGLNGPGALTFEAGSLIEIGNILGFSGPQAAAATVEPGAIVRLNVAGAGSATDPLNNYFAGKSPTFELYGANWPVNPIAANTTILTLNRGADGKGGMLVNRDTASTIVAVPNGVVAIGPNGGVMAATPNMTLTIPQAIALSSNELVIGSTEMVDRIMLPRLGLVVLNAPAGYNTATNGSKISIIPGVQLNNAVNSLPDAAEVAVAGIFNVVGADTIGALSGTGLVTLAANALTFGRNNGNATFSGKLDGTSGGLIKTGAGRQDLTGGNSTWTLTTPVVTVNGGTLALSGSGKLPHTGTTAFTLTDGGVLHLDNATVNDSNRLYGASPRIVFNGGTFRFEGMDGSASSEAVENASMAGGENTIDIINGTGAGSSAALTFAAWTAGAGTMNFTSSGEGALGSAGDAPRVFFTGLTANQFIPGASVGSAPAYYTTANGVRAGMESDATEFDGTTAQTGLDTKYTSANGHAALNAARSVKSVWINSPGTGYAIDLGSSGAFNLTLANSALTLTGSDSFEVKRSGSSSATLIPTAATLYVDVDDPGAALTIGVPIPASKSVSKNGAGTLVFNAAQLFNTMLTINNGTVKYGANGDLAAVPLTTWGTGLFDLAGKADTLGALTLFSGGITNSGAGGTLTSGALTLGSGPAGSTAFVHSGTGTLKLGGNVIYNVANDPDTATISGKLDLNGSTRTVLVNDSVAPGAYIDLDVPAVISGAAGCGIAKTGTGTMRLGGANTFDGPVSVIGTLRLSNPQALGQPVARAFSVAANSSLVLDGVNGDITVPSGYTALGLTGNGNTLLGPLSGALVNWSGNNTVPVQLLLGAATTLASLSDKLTLSTDIGGAFGLTIVGDGDLQVNGTIGTSAGTLIKNGAGTLTLKGANTFSGLTTINAGAVNVQHNTGLGTAAGNATVSIGGALQLQGGIAVGAELLTLRGQGVASDGALRNISGTNSYAGQITLGLTDVRINSDAGRLDLDVSSGSGIIGNTFNVIFGGEGDTTVADPIATTSGSLSKDGGGTLTLGGANTFTGPTTVNDGTLNVNGSVHTNSAVTVNNGGLLGGTGSCYGIVTVASGATVAPGVDGAAGGTLTVATLNLNAGGACVFEVSATPANDKIVVSGVGGLNLAAGTGIALYNAGTTNACTRLGTYNLIQYSGTLNGSVANLSMLNPRSDRVYTFVNEGGWIGLKVRSCIVSAQPATNLTLTGGRLNGRVVDAGAEAPSVFFCLDKSDKGTVSTSAWANVYAAGEWGTGQAFSNDVTGLLSGSNYTYRCYAANAVGASWSDEAVSFRPVYLPAVINTGARGVSPGVTLLQGEVTDTGSQAPQVWFLYWMIGGATTNVVGVGEQAGACSAQIADLPFRGSFGYMLMASNLAGVVYSGTAEFTVATVYHVSLNGNDANDGLSWPNALKTIPAAITLTQDGDTILVTNGTYTITAQITVDKGITLQGVNGLANTTITGNNTFRLFYVNHPYAVVSGLTLAQGKSIAGFTGGGVCIDTLGGTLQDCRITGCAAGISRTAVDQAAGLILRCIIDQNVFARTASGTVYLSGGEIINSLIVNNKVHNDGGGLYMTGGTARNCVIAGNEASGNGSGVWRSGTARLENCIIWGNIHRLDPTLQTRDLYGGTAGTVVNCCLPQADGTGTVPRDPAFVDLANGNYRLRPGSPCIDAGLTSVNTAAVDYGGSPRVIGGAIDIGAFEYDTGLFSCGFTPTATRGLAPLETTLVPVVYGTATATNLLENVWTISDGLSTTLVVTNSGLQNLTRTLDAGLYTVTLAVTDPAASATVATVVTNAVRVSPATLYVVAENTNACVPYASWTTAATNISDALALAWDGATILVSNGIYRISRQLVFDQAVAMESVNGHASTIIQAPIVANVRVLTLSHADARVDGFTLRYGRGGNGNPGGGALIGVAGGTLVNCRVTENWTGHYDAFGAGVRINGGRVASCIIDANRLTLDSMAGCGVYQTAGILENSLIITNETYSIAQNGGSGGGVSLNGGILRNCTIVGNKASEGGGVTRNGGTIQNCIIVDNVTGFDAGPGAPNWRNAHATAYQNVCTPASVGTGCVTADPAFLDAASSNYRLLLGSPCIDAGISIPELPETDLAGSPRVTGLRVDIGAYEYDARVVSCGISVAPSRAVTSADVVLTASVFGFDASTNLLHYTWVLDDEAGAPVQSGTGLSVVRHTYNALGRYNVRLDVYEPSSGKSAATVLTNAVHIAPATLYLVQTNALPVAPYDSWQKAATNIQDVMSEAVGGSAVLISNGTYEVAQTIVLNEGITLRGVNGYGRTTLRGNKVAGVRILDLNHASAVVEGLTIRGGMAAYIDFGSGVNISAIGGTLRRCLVTDNAQGGFTRGCGINQIGGLVTGCIISNNAACDTAGGIAITGGITENSLITASRAGNGGGVRILGGTLRNCTVTGNAATGTGVNGYGGGVWRDGGGTIINCIIWGNTANNTSEPGYPDWAKADATAYKNTCTSVDVGTGCIVGDPGFRNAANRDYRIISASPCRDKGLYEAWMIGATDLGGNPRIDLKQYVDIGAYENPSIRALQIILR